MLEESSPKDFQWGSQMQNVNMHKYFLKCNVCKNSYSENICKSLYGRSTSVKNLPLVYTGTEYLLSKIYLHDEQVHNYPMHITSSHRNVSATLRQYHFRMMCHFSSRLQMGITVKFICNIIATSQRFCKKM